MSAALMVPLTRTLTLASLGPATAAALQDLLHLPHELIIQAAFDTPNPRASDCINEFSRPVLIDLPPYPETIRLTALVFPYHAPTPNSPGYFADRLFASIEPQSRPTPFCTALQAAVALGLAREHRSEIHDRSHFFTTLSPRPAHDFLQQLRATTRSANPGQAALAFDQKLPKTPRHAPADVPPTRRALKELPPAESK